jgi:hypothetical protein
MIMFIVLKENEDSYLIREMDENRNKIQDIEVNKKDFKKYKKDKYEL